MNWLQKIFKSKATTKPVVQNKYTSGYFEGKEDFKMGKKLFSESVAQIRMPPERRKQKTISALEFFDKAIEKGYEEAEVFHFRGICLRDLNYDIDAIEDFDKSIEKEPDNANYWYGRAITKHYAYDYEGSLIDFTEAIRLSKFDNANTRFWNEYARQTEYISGTQKYEQDLGWMLYDKEQYEKSEMRREIAKERREKIKRRFQ
jgi:tetratricopeptide (TPR) repeat protein